MKQQRDDARAKINGGVDSEAETLKEKKKPVKMARSRWDMDEPEEKKNSKAAVGPYGTRYPGGANDGW